MRKLYVNFYFLFTFLYFTGSINSFAQTILFISDQDSTSQSFSCSSTISDSISALECLQNHGYWNAKINAFSKSTQPTVFGKLNTYLPLSKLTIRTPIDRSLIQEIKSKETVYEVNTTVLNYYLNKGYLYTDIQWSIDTILENSWQGFINISPYDLQYIDSLAIKSDPILKQKKWEKIIIPQNKRATRKLEKESDLKLKSLSFIDVNKPSKLLLTDKKNILFIFPKKKKVNYANGLIAFTNDKDNDQSGFTGNINLHLENILKSAEVFDLKWSAGNGNQDFTWTNSFKYVYRSIGLENQVKIYQQDSTFTKTQISIGLRIDSKPKSVWSVNYQFEQSAVDEPTNVRINYKKYLLLISWLNSNLQSNYFDRSGHELHVKTSIGNRITTDNKEAEYQIFASLTKIIPVSKTLRFVGEFQHKQLIQNTILENNAYNFGGFENMKGFIENRFLTTQYSLLTPTIRFSQQDKYVAELFYQHGFIKTIERENERLQSFGLQFILPVKSGWFNFGVSSGRVFPEPFNFSQALIHFGVKNNL